MSKHKSVRELEVKGLLTPTMTPGDTNAMHSALQQTSFSNIIWTHHCNTKIFIFNCTFLILLFTELHETMLNKKDMRFETFLLSQRHKKVQQNGVCSSDAGGDVRLG